MNTIFKCQFGSHIYGTNLPESDQDFKSIFIPSANEILLQRVPETIHQNTKLNSADKNSSNDIDHEMFSLQKWLKLLCQGQTVALDMLFTPKEFIITSSPTWEIIVDNKDKLIHKGISSFVGYTKAQAAKYGVKGFRVAAVESTLKWLQCFDPNKFMYEIGMDGLNRHAIETNYVAIVECEGPNQSKELYLEVCERKIQLKARIGYAIEVLQKIYDNYGHRAKLAQNNEGIDWKALMHAVRVAHEAVELLNTGKITFPRPEKELLLQIRKRELPYQQVAELIEEGLIGLTKALETSTLNIKPNEQWCEELVYKNYAAVINEELMYMAGNE